MDTMTPKATPAEFRRFDVMFHLTPEEVRLAEELAQAQNSITECSALLGYDWAKHPVVYPWTVAQVLLVHGMGFRNQLPEARAGVLRLKEALQQREAAAASVAGEVAA